MITSSRMELVTRCDGPLVLPNVDEPNEFSDGGTERHGVDEVRINAGDVPAAYTDRWPGLTWRAEVRYVYDVSDDTATFCGVGSIRDYGEGGPFKVGGTIDVEGRGPGVLVVIDKKSFELVTPAAANPQVRFLALCAARVEPADRVFVAINHELTGLDVAELDPLFDLDVIAHDTKQLLIHSGEVRAAARAGQPIRYQTGRWCRWCPAFAACPKQAELKALVRQDDEDPDLALQTTLLDEEDAPDVYELWKRIGILHKRVGQQLFAYAGQRPIPLGGGRMFGRVEKQGNERLSGDVVYQVVKELHGVAAADAAVIRTATKTRLTEALKGKRGAVPKVLELVRERGGSERKAGYEITEYAVGPRLVTSEDEPKQLPEAAAEIRI